MNTEQGRQAMQAAQSDQRIAGYCTVCTCVVVFGEGRYWCPCLHGTLGVLAWRSGWERIGEGGNGKEHVE